MKRSVLALLLIDALAGVANAASDAGLPAPPPATPQPSNPRACESVHDFVSSDCSLTWHGITVYGAYDVGVGWVSHGLPGNGYNYEGESLINRNGNNSQWLIAPNNLQQTWIGIKAKIEFMQDWFGVFNASTGFNPQSGQLANMAATNTTNNGLPRGSYSETGDGARAGQAFNDELYADHHFTKRVDVFAGVAYSDVSGGLAIAIPHGPGVPYLHNNNTAPSAGVRITF